MRDRQNYDRNKEHRINITEEDLDAMFKELIRRINNREALYE